MELTQVDQIIRDYDSRASSLVMILQQIQQDCGSLPSPALQRVAQQLSMDPQHVENVATFYRRYGLEQLSRALSTFVIDEEVCKGCGMCRRKCPVQAVSGVQKGRHAIDPEKCVRCGLCRDNCRLGAVLTIWHTEQEFVPCDRCGQPWATPLEIEMARAMLPTHRALAPVCPSCQRAHMVSCWAAAMLNAVPVSE